MTPIHDLRGSRVTVMGLGRFGGGIGVTRYLASRGAGVTVTDLASAETLAESIEKIRPLIDSGDVTLRLGAHDTEDFTSADLVVASPAVPKPWANALLSAAIEAGVTITTEIGLLVERLGDPSRIAGITGSAGKSTTTVMTAHAIGAILRERNDRRACHLGGNIGGSLLESIDAIAPDDLVVLELSSAMLHWLDKDRWSPGVAVVTNIAENHLDWHGDQRHYERSKRAILDHQCAADTAIVPEALEVFTLGARAQTTIIKRTAQTDDLDGLALPLPGAHNRDNAQLAAHAASAALRRAGIDAGVNACARTLATFCALPHRLQLVADAGGRRAYNDSKSTTPESAARAVEAILEADPPPPIHLLCGGSDKGADYAPLVEAAARCAMTYTIGLTGPTIAAQCREAGVPVTECGDLETAVRTAVDHAGEGSVILLSPACASYDQFRSYDVRGERFTELATATLMTRTETLKTTK